MRRLEVNVLVGTCAAAVLVGMATLGVACSSSSGGGAANEDAGNEELTPSLPEAGSPWCLADLPSAIGQIDECSRSSGWCPAGQTGETTCPTASPTSAALVGCCKGTAASPEGADAEVCVYADDYLAAEGGAQDEWCTCTSLNCFSGKWQSSP